MRKFLTAIMAVFFMFAVTGCGDDADCNAGTSDAQSESDVAAVTPEDVVASEGEGEGEKAKVRAKANLRTPTLVTHPMSRMMMILIPKKRRNKNEVPYRYK